MRRVRQALAAAAVPALAVSLASCGGARHESAGTVPSVNAPGHRRLQITPARPTADAEIGFRFIVPTAAGRHGSEQIAYSLSVTGPAGARCVGADEASGPSAARAGMPVSIDDGPRQTHKRWCPGSYTARVLELASARCSAGQACPQFIRVVGVVASGAFVVRE